ncbi:iron-containing alcohol dehydrogenase [Desulfurispora thermophila]|uniref:iron-containing alcohol dehydrogenase n=1 Tax=Desulfurispora thermophila TaxID=265470 RepID=UPI00038260E9|nr:iron-containing alcohol dehydrogenase [Desulfurispora thermophila]
MTRQRPTWWAEDPFNRTLALAAGASSVRGLQTAFFVPRILAGAQALNMLQSAVAGIAAAARVLIITDQVVRPLAERVAAALRPAGHTVEILDGVLPEVPVEVVEQGAAVAQQFAPQLIMAVGGGSAIDAAKIIWVRYEKPDFDFRQINILEPLGLRKKALLVAIPTTAGTGSEATGAAVLTEGGQKMSTTHPELVPDFAVLDPAFTAGMPPQLTAYTGLDALSHATGAFLSHWANEFTDPLALQAIDLVFQYLPRAVADGADMEARTKMQLAACLAGIAFANAACGPDHALGHSLGKVFGVHHGAAVGLFTPYAMGYVARVSDKYLKLADWLGIEPGPARERLAALCRRYLDFTRAVGAPTTIGELGITRPDFEARLPELVELALTDGVSLLSRRPATAENYRRLYQYAYDGLLVDF